MSLPESSSNQPEVHPGQRWLHFKGGEYTVLHVATNAETDAPVVVYQAEYLDRGIYTRSMRGWYDTVLAPGRTLTYVPRFTLIDEPLPEPKTEIIRHQLEPQLWGYLLHEVGSTDTTLCSNRLGRRDEDDTGFGGLPIVHQMIPEVYVAIGNNPDRVCEIVRIIEHEANSEMITVQRGCDYTNARSWSVAELWRVALKSP